MTPAGDGRRRTARTPSSTEAPTATNRPGPAPTLMLLSLGERATHGVAWSRYGKFAWWNRTFEVALHSAINGVPTRTSDGTAADHAEPEPTSHRRPGEGQGEHEDHQRLDDNRPAPQPGRQRHAPTESRLKGVDRQGHGHQVLRVAPDGQHLEDDGRLHPTQHRPLAPVDVQLLSHRIECEQACRPEQAHHGSEQQPRRRSSQEERGNRLAHPQRAGDHRHRSQQDGYPWEGDKRGIPPVDIAEVSPSHPVSSTERRPEVTGNDPTLGMMDHGIPPERVGHRHGQQHDRRHQGPGPADQVLHDPDSVHARLY